MPAIELRAVSRQYGSQFAIQDFSLEIPAGEFLVLVGKSGAGKSTLLRLVAGLESLDGGAVCLGGHDQSGIPASRRGLALVTQDAALYPQLSVQQNLLVRLQSLGRKQAMQRAQAALEAFGILHLAERLPSQLSGGEAQRVALAKAMASEPRTLLLDEPFSQLDALVKEPLLNLLYETTRSSGTTTLMVSHDPFDSLRLADRIAVVHAGRLVQCAAPEELYHRPQTRLAGDLLSPIPMNWIDRRSQLADSWQNLLGTLAERRRFVGFRPEAVELVNDAGQAARSSMAFQVNSSQSLGFARLLSGLLDGQPVRVQVPASQLPADLSQGRLRCRLDPSSCCSVDE